MTTATSTLRDQVEAASASTRRLAASSTAEKNGALLAIASLIEQREAEILAANERDISAARSSGLGEHVIERMMLNPSRVADMATAARLIADLDDPVGEVLDSTTRENGLRIDRVRVPLGVIGVIYESRPNVTIDIATLCLKSGNAVVLRGGKEAVRTNTVLADVARAGVGSAGLPEDAVQFVSSTDRALVREMLEMDDLIDLLIPRGSAELVHMVAEQAKMPAITGGIGVCHTYVDEGADLEKALDVVVNAKVQRPTVCNALDTVLVHSAVAGDFLPALGERFADAGVEMRVDGRALSVLGPKKKGTHVTLAGEDDFGQEFLALVASVKVVDSMDEAIDHIDRYGSGHSEAIITENRAMAERFLNEVDAAVVFHNASTRFNDGGEFGLGAEVAISTNKLHARGPMGLREITSYKWIVRGDGQIRS